ncbi:VOC family protein [Streptomyces sp. SPB074]|uniref:VOC family protein n=1 Tax=Streptomyces sp. (strain SPB074) TaxID=465543 RepID=UPI0005656B77|nr:VOC family protein [Streptomyces sp. SPB074]
MPEITSPYATGTPCWVDLMARDQRNAIDFYSDLLGWQGQPGPGGFGGYAICEVLGKAVAGIGKAPEDQPEPPNLWTTYLATTDAQATQDTIISAGGSLVVPVVDVGDLGRMLIAADPQGAVFGVWQAGEFAGARLVNEAGALIWNELHAADVPTAAAFYGEVFGANFEPFEGAEDYWAVKVAGKTVGGATGLKSDPPGTPAHWLTYFAVDDVDSTADALIRRDGTVLAPPFDMVAGRMAVVADPEGARFALIEAPSQ